MTAETKARLEPSVAPARAPTHQPPSTRTDGASAPSRKPINPRTSVKKAQLVRYPTLGRRRIVRAPDTQKKAPRTTPGHQSFVVFWDRAAVIEQAATKESSNLEYLTAFEFSAMSATVRLRARKSLRSCVPQAKQQDVTASTLLLLLEQSTDEPTMLGRMDRTKVSPTPRPQHLVRKTYRETTRSVLLVP